MSDAAKKQLHRKGISKTDGENRQLESHHQDKLEALSALIKINTAIGFMPMNLKASLRFLVDETKTLFDAHGCAIFSLDGDVNFDVVFSGSPDMEVGLPKRFGNTQKCLVVRDELPFIVQDATRQDKGCCGLKFGERIESFVCLPVSTGNKLVGVLVVGSLRKRAFSRHHLEMMLSVATMAASVIQRAQLFQKLEAEKGRLEMANEAINKLNTDLETKIADLKEAQKQIIQTEKLAVAGRLAAGVAHEVNNPVGIIINRIECLQSEAQEKGISDDVTRDLLTIERYAHKISKIVEDLSIFSRTTYSESECNRIDINEVLNDVFFLVEQKIRGKKVRFIKRLYPEGVFVMGDSGKLEQVFINIIDNAIDAVSGNGSITVSTRAEQKCIQIKISDSGAGMPEDHLDQIYDPFFTTKEVGKGTGLGLPISRAIVEDHNGSIVVSSRIDSGTTFTIIFPEAPGLDNELI
ncbi:MAG: GAF domain-containing protein [Deltaproteobacteria bacterium]|nr:GAF domain-containing protein [Deltaproteobacteria bacterium]